MLGGFILGAWAGGVVLSYKLARLEHGIGRSTLYALGGPAYLTVCFVRALWSAS